MMIFHVTSHDSTTSKVMKKVQVKTILIWHQCNNDLFQRNLIGVLKLSFVIIEPEGNVEPRIEQTLTTVAVRAGTTAELVCAAQGNPPPTYRYFYVSFISTIYTKFVKNFTDNCLGAV